MVVDFLKRTSNPQLLEWPSLAYSKLSSLDFRPYSNICSKRFSKQTLEILKYCNHLGWFKLTYKCTLWNPYVTQKVPKNWATSPPVQVVFWRRPFNDDVFFFRLRYADQMFQCLRIWTWNWEGWTPPPENTKNRDWKMCCFEKTCCTSEEQTGLDIMKQDSGNTGERGLWETWLVQSLATDSDSKRDSYKCIHPVCYTYLYIYQRNQLNVRR